MTKNPGDYTKVKAIKIVGKNGTTLEPYILSAYHDEGTNYDPKLSEAAANNTFSVIYNDEAKSETDVVSKQAGLIRWMLKQLRSGLILRAMSS